MALEVQTPAILQSSLHLTSDFLLYAKRLANYKGRLTLPKRLAYSAYVTKRRNPHAVALGRKGGKARLTKLTAEQRREIARKAARARWTRRRPSIPQ